MPSKSHTPTDRYQPTPVGKLSAYAGDNSLAIISELVAALKFQDSNAPYSRKLERVHKALKLVGEENYTSQDADACDDAPSRTALKHAVDALVDADEILDGISRRRASSGDASFNYEALASSAKEASDCRQRIDEKIYRSRTALAKKPSP